MDGSTDSRMASSTTSNCMQDDLDGIEPIYRYSNI